MKNITKMGVNMNARPRSQVQEGRGERAWFQPFAYALNFTDLSISGRVLSMVS